MNRASPVELRKAMDTALALMKAGILFVPMPVRDHIDHAQLVGQCTDRLEALAVATEAALAVVVPEPVASITVPPPTVRYFINRKSRMCRMLKGAGEALEALVAQARAERFVEVSQEHQTEFQAETQQARDAGWKPFGRVSYESFMRKQAVKS